jgi:carbon starvation protein
LIKTGASAASITIAKLTTTQAQKKETNTEKLLISLGKQLQNQYIDALVTAVFLALVVGIITLSVREWLKLIRRSQPPTLHETEPVWIPLETAARPLPILGAVAFGLTMLKELSGQAAIDREQAFVEKCPCAEPSESKSPRKNVFLTSTEHRYRGINHCC